METESESKLGRPELADGEHKQLVNFKLDEDVMTRMKVICFRRTIHYRRLFSEAAFVAELINETRLPPEPAAAKADAFLAAFPSFRKGGGREFVPNSRPKKVFNCALHPAVIARMKTICFRRSVHRMRPLTEGAFLAGCIIKAEMPRAPDTKAIAEYLAAWPKARGRVEKLSGLTPKRLSRNRA